MSATRWASTLLHALRASGARHAVVSPGARSTPLAHAAATTPELVVHSIIDERSAGFFALGQARVTGAPTILIATSGSAAAHYFPAIVEAKHAGLPLLVLTADRPFELQHAGAAQTVDQLQMFGAFVQRFFELGSPDSSPVALEGLANLAARAVRVAVEEGGVVHINARFRKPLEPSPGERLPIVLPAKTERRRGKRGPGHLDLEWISERVAAAERPVVVAGPLSPFESPSPALLGLWASKIGAPVLAEATSQLRFADLGQDVQRGDRFDLYLDLPGAFDLVSPDLVVELGRTPTSKSYAAFLDRHPSLDRIVVSPTLDADPSGSARLVLAADLELTLDALRRAAEPRAHRRDWLSRFREWESKVDRVQATLPVLESPLPEDQVAPIVVDGLPPGAALMVGNSLPVRHLDRWVAWTGRSFPVLSQRGLNGIDGLVSGAAGSAIAAARPLALLVGDVSFLHDLGGLWAARLATTPLVIVAINNDGGRIFDELPLGEDVQIAPHKDLWTTPHGLGFGGVAETFGLRYEAAFTTKDLRASVAQAFLRPGATIIEARVSPGSARARWRAMRAALAEDRGP